ncbi:hypothetical protein [Actinoplanes sp. ATCC 53533]|uniref:DUF6932 family protein n=1 Tax=Actinoplanes sp. ATCC 53533 TaxID=1288362 RepID=UPI000F7B9CF7|nr:hypothetical protein [Actinoplanes sp. ATCC 53533]
MPEFDPTTGFLPPGRYSASLDDLYARLVRSTGSIARQEIWREWDDHRTIVGALAGEITRMWVGGSFVSSKVEPSDVDVTYLLRAEAFDRLDAETLADLDDLTLRGWCVKRGMRVDAYLVRLPENRPVSQMITSMLTQADAASFRDVGIYDEFWQRVKPTAANGIPGALRRGYVEVLL